MTTTPSTSNKQAFGLFVQSRDLSGCLCLLTTKLMDVFNERSFSSSSVNLEESVSVSSLSLGLGGVKGQGEVIKLPTHL